MQLNINKCNINELHGILKEIKHAHLKAIDICFKVHVFEMFGIFKTLFLFHSKHKTEI